MITDVNLLKEKEKISLLFIIITSVIIFVSLLLVSWIVLEYRATQTTLEATEQQLDTTIKARKITEQKVSQLQTSSSVEDLENIVQWVETIPISTVRVLNFLSTRLPERGYFLKYTYADNGKISLTLQFDTLREISSYIYELNRSDWIRNLSLSSVSTKSIQNVYTSQLQEENIAPRYIAEVQIDLNVQAMGSTQGEER